MAVASATPALFEQKSKKEKAKTNRNRRILNYEEDCFPAEQLKTSA